MTSTVLPYDRLMSGAASLVILFAASASAQPRAYVGPGKCIDCHDHQDEKAWAETRDGDGKGKRHLKALDQLDDSKAATWAKAIGVVDVYDVKGACVRCHATVVRGSADFGVSCESCHGAGQDYLKPHQDKGSYQAAVALGMKDTVKKPEAWVRDCQGCHVLGATPGDAALVKAGHPSGDQFDLSTKFSSVALHWTSKYATNQIAALSRPARTDTRVVAPPASSIPGPIIPPNVSQPTNAAPATTPAVVRVAPAIVPPAIVPPAPPHGTPAYVPADAPPVAPLPIATPDMPAPQSPARVAAALHGRVIGVLHAMLGRGTRIPVRVIPPAPTLSYRGADAELLQLQREVIALALETLGAAPPAKTPPSPK